MNIQKFAAQILKEAAFPKVLLSLNEDTRSSLSRAYSIGPKSEQKEIDIESVTRKPFTEQLLVYTVPQMDEDAKRREKYKRSEEIEKDPQYQDIRGSRAGEKWLKEKLDALEIELNEKYTKKEVPIAYAVGTNITSLRRRDFSNRKHLAEWVKSQSGKVYAITPDPDVEKSRAEHQKFRPSEAATAEQQIAERGAKLLKSKLPQLEALLDEELAKAKAKMLENIEAGRKTQLDALEDDIQKGKTEHYHSLGALPKVEVMKGVDTKKIETLKDWIRKAQGSRWAEVYGSNQELRDDEMRKQLVQLVKSLDELLK
jgi:hypothetical protein